MADLAALLTGPAARDALARRDITAVFRILRDAGVSQVRIAAATGQRQPEVSEIVSGR
jgi:predicted XRE-type DNA-binding protein